jgi:segregation and condensation protein A
MIEEQIYDDVEVNAESFPIKIEGFEGPLDLLLYLIRNEEIDIYDIPIAKITEQYLAFLAYTARIELENLTEFYLMAATLLYIKSRMLLPMEVNLEEEFEDPRRELVEKLIEYQKYKKLSELIAEKERESEWLLERRVNQRLLPFQEDDLWQEIDLWDLVKSFSTIIASLNMERIIDLYEEVSINEKITLIRELIEEKREFLFTDLFSRGRGLLDVICAFFALLEMVKSKEIVVLQNKLFGDIRIKIYGER